MFASAVAAAQPLEALARLVVERVGQPRPLPFLVPRLLQV
jgi:hypothetical protein